VTESHTAIAEKPRAGTAASIGWAVLILATMYVCYFRHLGVIGFAGPDEPRYAWIARDMGETGDWVTPRLYGNPWFEKPPLFYWGAAVCFRVFGVSETAARLPSAISALLATLALAWLVWRLYGAEAARWLLLLLPTSVGMIGFSHAAATDMPFTGMLTIAMVAAAVVLGLTRDENTPVLPRTPWLALVLFGFFLGLAILAKGPAAILLSGGAVFFWALFTQRWRDAFRLFHPLAIVTLSATALPWYLLCARRNPDFFRIFIIEHNFKRFLTAEFQHIQPFWFYLPVLLVAFLPWTFLLLCSAFGSSRNVWRRREISPSGCFLLCWAGFCVLFFTVSRSKLPGYVLPAVPAIAALLARDLSRRLEQGLRNASWACGEVALAFVAMGVAAELQGRKIPFVTDIHPAPTVVQFYALMFLAGIAIATLAVLRRAQIALVIAAIALPAFLIFGMGNFWELDGGVSARPAALGALNHLTKADLDKATDYKLKRGLGFGLNFYLHRELRQWTRDNPQHSIIFTSVASSKELETLGARCESEIAYPAVITCEVSQGVPSLMRGVPGSGEPK
jgi:4-amino-4-deoxy-L-arabinose transferase-like glycosyltransferase